MTKAILLEYIRKLQEDARSGSPDGFGLGILCACAEIIEHFDLEEVDAVTPGRA